VTTLDVRTWLQARGFGAYADLFESNQIDVEALPGLNEAHLKELGIPLGHRIKLLQATRELSAAPVQSAGVAERRQLTVMFVDMVGSTALSARLDPEDLRRVVRAYQAAVAAEIRRYDGSIAQYLGDGVLAYFGYPNAHEDDAERAVRAALAVLGNLAGVKAPGGEPLAARVGIATGLVIVGDLLGEGNARESAVVGETPNLAARLQGLAAAGEIVLSSATRNLVEHLFELKDLGARQLKGMPAPVMAYAVVAERAVESRFEARRTGQLSSMIGRDEELEVLTAHWRRVREGASTAILISGEAGIGKSRILRALQDRVAADPHFRISYQCSPHHSGSALHPVIHQILRAAQIAPGDSTETKLDRLEALLAATVPGDRSELPIMAALLGIDGQQRYGPLKLAPQKLRQRTFDALIGQLLRIARQQPVLWVLEDAHWIDPTTLELLDAGIERIAHARILVVITARPEFRHAFAARSVIRLALNRLGRDHVPALVRGVTRGKALPDALLREVAARTDGVPLFVEELTKTLLESGALRETPDAFVLAGPLQDLSIPASLQDSLMARLDRLQPVKEVAQTAACIGREFGFDLLASVARMQTPALREALERLIDAELIHRKGSAANEQYAFKHALVRDAAYESLLKTSRQEIHRRLVVALEAAPQTPAEMLAHHATQAELREKAIDYWQKAGANAMATPAFAEAIGHLDRGLRLAEQMEDSRPWRERRLLLLIMLGQASIPLLGYSHPQTVSVFKRAQELVGGLPDAPHRFAIFYAVWVAHYVRGEHDRALETAREMLARAESEGNKGHRITALRSLAMSEVITGTPAAAIKTFDQGRLLAAETPPRTREQRIALADRFATDPEIGHAFHVALAHWGLGRIDAAMRGVAEALESARALGHVHTLCHALAYSALFAAVRHDLDRALALSNETIEFAGRHEFVMWKGYGSAVKACALWQKDDATAAAPLLQGAFDCLERTHTGATLPLYRATGACVLAKTGDFEGAGRLAAQVRAELQSGSERYFWPECQRLYGDYLMLCPGADMDAAASAYEEALLLARQQGTIAWELKAAISLARLLADRGERARALALLEPLNARFTEGRDAPLVKDAEALISSLH